MENNIIKQKIVSDLAVAKHNIGAQVFKQYSTKNGNPAIIIERDNIPLFIEHLKAIYNGN